MLQGGNLFIAVGSEPFDIIEFATGVGSEFMCDSVSLLVCACVYMLTVHVVPSVKLEHIYALSFIIVFTLCSSQNETMP